MRFKEGSKVEVWSKKDMPSGSWRCAEIVRNNGQSYTVRYIGDNDRAAMEMVFENEIRPCPPQCKIAGNLVCGDVVEVFDNFSWKMAIICKILCEEYFMVRLLGSLLEFEVSRFSIRTRQSWQDDKWILIGKGSGKCEDAKQHRNSILKFKSRNNFQIAKTRSDEHVKWDFSLDMNNEIVPEANDNSGKKPKRRHYYNNTTKKKHRAVEKEGKPQRASSHDIAFGNKTMGRNFTHSCLNDQSRLSEMDITELDSENDSSSVGSCSISGSDSCNIQNRSSFADDASDCYSYAGSFCQRGKEESDIVLHKTRELAAKIHMLELHAYRCTMEALYASGPLSWDKEAMVTNLRLSLNISNDEHLMEVRNLVSADNSVPSR